MANPEPLQECIIESHEEWMSSLLKKVGEALKKVDEASQDRREGDCTIFRAPPIIREQDCDAYEPKIISLGPYHHGKPSLQAKKELKLFFLSSFLHRNPHVALQDYLRMLQTQEKKARCSYSEDIDMKSNEFVEMLLLDSCFVVEFLLQFRDNSYHHPFFKKLWAWSSIAEDMLMLENQLPFFVLESIFDLAISPDIQQSCSLKNLAFYFCNSLIPKSFRMPSERSVPRFHHLVHVLHYCLAPPENSNADSDMPTPESIPCAKLLAEAGVKFRTTEEKDKSFFDQFPPTTSRLRVKASITGFLSSSRESFQKRKSKSLLDITFVNGVLSIPTLEIYDETNLLFRNLIAFEQCFPDAGNHVSAYLAFMDCIIDTPKDVVLLRRKKVIVNCLGSDEDAALLFNNLCKGVVIMNKTGYLSNVFKDVAKHCDSRWNNYRRNLMHDYFNSPWAIISIVAAVILLILTAIQAVFSVLPYFKAPK